MKALMIVIAIGVVALGSISLAEAGIPSTFWDGGGIFTGCYWLPAGPTTKGTLRLIDKDKGEQCRVPFEQEVHWNAQGERGPAGEQGPPGPSPVLHIVSMCPEPGLDATKNFVKWMKSQCPPSRAGDTQDFYTP